MIDVAINPIVIIISQNVPMSNHQGVHFKFLQFYCQLYLNKAGGKK